MLSSHGQTRYARSQSRCRRRPLTIGISAATRCAGWWRWWVGNNWSGQTCATRAGNPRKRCDLHALPPDLLRVYRPARRRWSRAQSPNPYPENKKTAQRNFRGRPINGSARAGATVAWPTCASNPPASKLPPRVYRPAGPDLPRAQSPSACRENPPQKKSCAELVLRSFRHGCLLRAQTRLDSTIAGHVLHSYVTVTSQLRHSYVTVTS